MDGTFRFITCELENANRVLFGEAGNNIVVGSDTYVSLYLSEDKSFSPLLKIDSPGVYGGCYLESILAYTNDNKLYLECGAGDGGYANAEIHRMDFNFNSVEQILRCESRTDSDSLERIEVGCE